MYLRLRPYVTRDNSKVEAIKELRSLTNCTLKEGKYVVDTLWEKGYINFEEIKKHTGIYCSITLGKSLFFQIIEDIQGNQIVLNTEDKLRELIQQCINENDMKMAESLLNVYNTHILN